MIYDTFMFSHELDLLEVRLKYLWDHVDVFVIAEFPFTHSGEEKPLVFAENAERFAWASDKIVHIVGHDLTPINHGGGFSLEYAQRDFLYNETLKMGHPEDIMLISDIDEIPSIEGIEIIESKLPAQFVQDFYYYNVHCPRNKKWMGTRAVRFSDKYPSVWKIREKHSEFTPVDGGWHFSYFMSLDDIIVKLKSFAHAHHLGEPPYTDKDYIMGHIEKNTSFINKPDGDLSFGPIDPRLMKELKNYPVFVGEYE